MNYRHAYHAGNFADVLKHAVLVWVVRYLQQKAAPLCLVDTHAGMGFYALTDKAATKTGEAKDGIQRLAAAENIPVALVPYLELVRKSNPGSEIEHYPGSPWLMAALARPSDRVIACERHPEDGVALRSQLGLKRAVQIVEGDGYQALAALVPPREKRGLVLVDPPFEETDEFETLAGSFIAAHRKWPTGTYMLWHPVKDLRAVARFHAELVNANIRKLLTVTLDTGRTEPGLSAMGLVLCNAPFTFETEWRPAVAALAKVLAQGPRAGSAIERLTGE
ncbi:MAG: 23S rRNA (adenine(2030)-N(6))-methyltransferase RlmJ [Alphaproteobacteria bacterium]|nr:23S rRNA (adenine(2030)-N(6))-methyltransferase RlmJ [Alphaproteobacteria bacterium]